MDCHAIDNLVFLFTANILPPDSWYEEVKQAQFFVAIVHPLGKVYKVRQRAPDTNISTVLRIAE